MNLNLTFEYALQAPNGAFYSGRAGVFILSTNPMDIFTYTEEGAHRKKASSPYFHNFAVVRI